LPSTVIVLLVAIVLVTIEPTSLGAAGSIYAVDLRYEPYLFYVQTPLFYFSGLEDLPATSRFFLIQSKDLPKLQADVRWSSLQPRLLAHTNLFCGNDTMLFNVTANQLNQ
jgi:hypothetical protein